LFSRASRRPFQDQLFSAHPAGVSAPANSRTAQQRQNKSLFASFSSEKEDSSFF
jgi:hypothetical protein